MIISMTCINCGHDVDENSNYCPQCGQTIKGCNIEDFLNDHFRIFAIIGVFGAISLYLSNFSANNENNFLLQAGSLLSLSIVVLLSIDLYFRISPYIKNCAAKEENIEESYRSWIKMSWDVFQLQIFRWINLLIFGCIALFLLFYSDMNSVLLNSVGTFLFLLVSISFIYKPTISIVRTKENYHILFFVLGLMLIGISIYYLYTLLTDFSKTIFLFPIPVVSIFTLYRSYIEYKLRTDKSNFASPSVEESQNDEKTDEDYSNKS